MVYSERVFMYKSTHVYVHRYSGMSLNLHLSYTHKQQTDAFGNTEKWTKFMEGMKMSSPKKVDVSRSQDTCYLNVSRKELDPVSLFTFC